MINHWQYGCFGAQRDRDADEMSQQDCLVRHTFFSEKTVLAEMPKSWMKTGKTQLSLSSYLNILVCQTAVLWKHGTSWRYGSRYPLASAL